MIRVIVCPVPFKLRLHCKVFHFRFDIRHCMHTYGTHNGECSEVRRILAMTHAGVLLAAAAMTVAVAAAQAERNSIRGCWTRQRRKSISSLPCAISSL